MTKERNMKKLTILLAVTYLCLVNKAVIANENCDSAQSYSHYCQNRIENLQTLNHQFNKAYSSGSVVNISQPPLVVMPEILSFLGIQTLLFIIFLNLDLPLFYL